MRTREEILNEVLALSREIEESQKRINELYKEAKEIDEPDDTGKYSYLEEIRLYTS